MKGSTNLKWNKREQEVSNRGFKYGVQGCRRARDIPRFAEISNGVAQDTHCRETNPVEVM